MINGIDVSHHNDVDWTAFKQLNISQKVYFAYLKASEGTNFTDNKFAANRKGGTDAGLLCGAYHFFIPTQDAVAQAKLFAAQIGTMQAGEIPPVVDIEWNGIKKSNGTIVRPEHWSEISAAQRIKVIKTFLVEAEQRIGVKCAIYTHPTFWRDFITKNNQPADYAFFVDYPLWMVNLKGTFAVPPPWKIATFVQNGFGELAPKNATAFEKLDHDYFNGKLTGLLAFATKGKVFAKNAPVSAFVYDFQQALKAKGFYAKPLDGDFGKNTEAAVKAFQQSINLPDTGKIDEVTWKMLL